MNGIRRTSSSLAGAAVCLIASAAFAQDLPDLDPVKMCRKQAAAIEQGDWLVKACLDQEQEAYDTLKEQWPGLDTKTRQLCVKQARVISSGYWMIQACVAQELQAREELKNFEFKK